MPQYDINKKAFGERHNNLYNTDMLADENGRIAGVTGNPLHFYLDTHHVPIPGVERISIFGERASMSTAPTGNDIWQGAAIKVPTPPTAGEQMTVVSSNAADRGIPEGTMTSATHATALDDTGATFTTHTAAIGDIIYNVTDGSETTILTVDSQTGLTTNALTGGTNNVWSLNDVYHINGGGTGVRSVEIHYLDGAGVEHEEYIILNGATGVLTQAQDITFVNDMYATEVDVDGTGVAVGNLIIHQTGTPTTIYNMIALGGNKSLTCVYKVPSDRTLFVKSWQASVASGAGNKPTVLRLRSTNHHNTIQDGIFIFKDNVYLETSAVQIQFEDYLTIPAGAIIKITGWTLASGSSATGGIEGKTVLNSLIAEQM
jgi:hypothetical protein